MKACRGTGASLSEEDFHRWESEPRKLLFEIAPEQFDILHYGAIAQLKRREITDHGGKNDARDR